MKKIAISLAFFIVSFFATSLISYAGNFGSYPNSYQYVLDMMLAGGNNTNNPALLSKAYFKDLGNNNVYVYVQIDGDGKYIDLSKDDDQWVKYSYIKLAGKNEKEMVKTVDASNTTFKSFSEGGKVIAWEMEFTLENTDDLHSLITNNKIEAHTQVFDGTQVQTSGSLDCNNNCNYIPPGGAGPNIPIDGGLSFLLAAGLGYGVYKKRK